MLPLGLPLTSSFLLEYSSEYLNVNNGSSLMQAAYDEERVVSRRTWGPKGQGLEQTSPLHVYIQISFQAGKWTYEIAKPQVSTNSSNSSIDCKKLQPEMELCNRK